VAGPVSWSWKKKEKKKEAKIRLDGLGCFYLEDPAWSPRMMFSWLDGLPTSPAKTSLVI